MVLENLNRAACLFGIMLRALHRDHHQIRLANGKQHDLGRGAFKVDHDERRLGSSFLDPVDDGIFIDIGHDRKVRGQGGAPAGGSDSW